MAFNFKNILTQNLFINCNNVKYSIKLVIYSVSLTFMFLTWKRSNIYVGICSAYFVRDYLYNFLKFYFKIKDDSRLNYVNIHQLCLN